VLGASDKLRGTSYCPVCKSIGLVVSLDMGRRVQLQNNIASRDYEG
jgi:hypothetical protein